MRIAIEASRIVIPKLTGVGGSALALMPHLVNLAVAHGHTIDLLAQKGQKCPFALPAGARWLTLGNPLGGAWTQTSLAYNLWRNNYDIVFFPASPIPFLTIGKMVGTVHDVAFLNEPEVYSKKERLLLLTTTRFTILHGAKIFVPTQKVATDLISWLPSVEAKIKIVPHGVDHKFYTAKNKQGEKYLLHIGRVETKKATEELIPMLKKIRESGWLIPLIFMGPFGFAGDKTIEACKKLNLRFAVSSGNSWPKILEGKEVVFLDYVPLEIQKKIYEDAFAVVNLSVNEGFGLPVLEAMATKTPVIVCAGTATAEVNEDKRCWVAPHSPEQAAELLLFWKNKPSLVLDIAEKGYLASQEFSWEQAAAEKLKALEESAAI